MKTKMTLGAMFCISLFYLACLENEPAPQPNPENGEKSSIVITVAAGNADTRATRNDAPPSLIADDGLKVYIFNTDGTLDYSSANGPLALNLNSNGNYETSEITVTAGGKLFFVFANDKTTGEKITPPAANSSVNEFTSQILDITFDGDVPDVPLIKGPTFLLGTLWEETVIAPGGGVSNAPHVISLEIGRLVSKINLKKVEYTIIDNNSGLKGSFSDPKYRLGTIPLKIFTVGHYEGSQIPVGYRDVEVISAVHNALPWSSTDFTNFRNYSVNWLEENESFYTIENTTGKDNDGLQYFGNTTFIQLETIYTPHADEVYDPEYLSSSAILTDNTFWTARILDNPTSAPAGLAGKKIILNAEPIPGTMHQDIDKSTVSEEYKGGKNYHKFPVFDDAESNPVSRNRVLRNHYYEFIVNKFLDLGSAGEDIDPKEPIPTETTISIEVTVKPWDIITGETPVG